MRSVLLTHASGALARAVLPSLLDHPLVRRVTAVDVRPPGFVHPKLVYRPADLRDRVYLRAVLEEEEVDAALHLPLPAWAGAPPGDPEERVAASLALAEACAKAPHVTRLLLAGSCLCYGAGRRPALFIKEDSPLRATDPDGGGTERRIEESVAEFVTSEAPKLELGLIRLSPSALPGAGGLIGWLRSAPMGLSPLVRDFPLQVTSPRELGGALCRLLEAPGVRGPYNLAPDDYTNLRAVFRRRGARLLSLPTVLLPLAAALQREGLARPAASFLRHPLLLSNQRAKTLGIEFPTPSEDALFG